MKESKTPSLWLDLEARIKGRIEDYGPYLERVRELVDDRDSGGKMLQKIHGRAYELLLAGLETDVLYQRANQARKDAAARFWRAFGKNAGLPGKMEVDFTARCIRTPCCPACTMFWMGATFETSEFAPEIELHELDLDA